MILLKITRRCQEQKLTWRNQSAWNSSPRGASQCLSTVSWYVERLSSWGLVRSRSPARIELNRGIKKVIPFPRIWSLRWLPLREYRIGHHLPPNRRSQSRFVVGQARETDLLFIVEGHNSSSSAGKTLGSISSAFIFKRRENWLCLSFVSYR